MRNLAAAALASILLFFASWADDFNRAAGNSLGANWTEVEAVGSALEIEDVLATNHLGSTTSTSWGGFACYNQTFADSQFSEAVYHTGDALSGPCVRLDIAGSVSSATGYCAVADGGGSPDVRLVRWSAQNFDIGTGALLASDTVAWSGSGNLVRIEANGSTIRVLIDSSEVLNVTDGLISSGCSGFGSVIHTSGFTNFSNWDDWAGGDIEGSAGYMSGMIMKKLRVVWPDTR